MNIKVNILVLFQIIIIFNIYGQDQSFSSIEFYHGEPIQGFDNYFQVLVQQEKTITIERLQAKQINSEGDTSEIKIIAIDNGFKLKPTDYGQLLIEVKNREEIESKKFRIKRITAVSRLGKFKSNYREKVQIGEFKSQIGISAPVECCGFDAKCKVIGFNIIRMSTVENGRIAFNEGGKFSIESRKLINEATSDNIYVFRNIQAQCPGKNNIQWLSDIILEIE